VTVKFRVLVIDDAPDICDILRLALESTGLYRVTVAFSGDGALAVLTREHPDLLILDAVIPGLSSVELAIEALGRGIPVLFMTGAPMMMERLDGLGLAFLRKPFRLDELYRQTRRAIARAQDDPAALRDARDNLLASERDRKGPPERG
jgi:DNA-binding response OmpR family regulator